MLNLLSRDRGDLDQRVEISVTNGEEHFKRDAGMDLNIFTKAMAHWLLGAPNREKIEPSGKIVTAALAEHKGCWYYWQATGDTSEQNKTFLSTVYANIHHRTDEEARRIVHASQLVFFNLGRTQRAGVPIAKVRFHRGGGSVLHSLDCDTNEAAGLLYALRDCHINISDDIYTTGFFNFVQVKKTPPAEPKKKGTSVFGNKRESKDPTDAMLLRKLQNYRIQCLL